MHRFATEYIPNGSFPWAGWQMCWGFAGFNAYGNGVDFRLWFEMRVASPALS